MYTTICLTIWHDTMYTGLTIKNTTKFKIRKNLQKKLVKQIFKS